MIKGERPTFSGKWYHVREATANPRLREHIPLMIGGSGEKKTIPLAARHFDHLNVMAEFDELPAKVKVVRQLCEEIGRDPATLETSTLITVVMDENFKLDQIPAEMIQHMAVGSAESVADQLKTKVIDAGIDSLIINMPFYTPGIVKAAGEALRPLVGL
jgi:alkanesulfonate monooxygenase SsuD/methylene tetrahydromethanopterin reductase-like flavin-dependent oxidoreductase (luciferase family)